VIKTIYSVLVLVVSSTLGWAACYTNLTTGEVYNSLLTDGSGYVTNVDALTPFTMTNAEGVLITNAVMVRLMDNKFVYKTASGDEGTLRMDTLSKEMQERFRYDAVRAAAADRNDHIKKTVAEANTRAELSFLREQDKQERAYKIAISKQAAFYADVHEKVYGGLIVVTPGEYGEEDYRTNIVLDGRIVSVALDSKIMLKHYRLEAKVIYGDQIHTTAFPIGNYSHDLANGETETLPAWTCDTNEAVEYYLTH
jgi:hypothetical protein